MEFDAETIQDFIKDGFLHYPGAIPSEVITECREWMIEDAGIKLSDPSSWTKPVVRIGGSRAKCFWLASNQPGLYEAFDALIGKGRWKYPVQGTGSFPIRFPSEQDPGDTDWHIDGSFVVDNDIHVTLDSKERALLMLILFSDITEDDAPTRIRRGSHLLVPKCLPRDLSGVSFQTVVPQLPELNDLPIDLATGRAGDVYLCHPFLVHAASFPHRGDSPRFLSQPGVAHELPYPDAPYDGLITNGRFNLDREDGDYSPVEQAILLGLER